MLPALSWFLPNPLYKPIQLNQYKRGCCTICINLTEASLYSEFIAILAGICLIQLSFLSIDLYLVSLFCKIPGKQKSWKPLIYRHSGKVSANGVLHWCFPATVYSLPAIHKIQHDVCRFSCKPSQNQPGDGKMHRLSGTLEECLESLSFLPQ